MPGPLLSGESLYRDLVAYTAFGDHRTGSEVDFRTSDWIAGRLEDLGFRVGFQDFAVHQFFLEAVSLRTAGQEVPCFPLWPPLATGPAPLRARLAPFDAPPDVRRGAIALLRFPYNPTSSVYPGSGHAEMLAPLIEAGARAVVAVTDGPTGEIIALNSMSGPEPRPVPIVLVSPRDAASLAAAADQGLEASLSLTGRDDPGAPVRNVIASLDRGGPLIVVSTPQSGWFRCGGERGPGIALLLGLASWAAARQTPTSYLFVSTTGHEMQGPGIRAYVRDQAPPPDKVLCWLALGAGIAVYAHEATADGVRRLPRAEKARRLMATPDLLPILREAFDGLPDLRPETEPVIGEIRAMIETGYRTFGIGGGHAYHHTPGDGPEVSGPELLEPVAQALVRALEMIEARDRRRPA